MRMPGEPGGEVRRRPQCELRDDPNVGVCSERLRHVGREVGAGGQLLPAPDERVGGEEACPLRSAGARLEESERSVRLGRRVDVGSG
jgi:hypothetical protein